MTKILVDVAVLEQALEALESLFTLQVDYNRPKQCGDAIAALKAALEQPEQEPVASIYVTIGGDREFDDWRCPLPVGTNLLYPHPPRREWRGLTDEGREQATGWSVEHIEAKLKEKNHE